MFVFGVILEIIGLLGMGINYPIYRKLLAMGRMIWLMIKINSDFTYLGYIIYLSALYTFYTIGMLIGNLVKYKKLSSPILSATKVLNFVSSMVSLLDLQMAMITRFSANG